MSFVSQLESFGQGLIAPGGITVTSSATTIVVAQTQPWMLDTISLESVVGSYSLVLQAAGSVYAVFSNTSVGLWTPRWRVATGLAFSGTAVGGGSVRVTVSGHFINP